MKKPKLLITLSLAALLASCNISFSSRASSSSTASDSTSSASQGSSEESETLSSDEDPSSEEPSSEESSSEEPSSEELSSDEESTSTELSSEGPIESSSQSSGIDFSYDAHIALNSTNKSTALTSLDGHASIEGIEVSGAELSKVYGSESGAFRLGTSTSAGSMTLSLATSKYIKSVIVYAERYNATDSSELHVYTSAHRDGAAQTIKELNYYVFDDFSEDNQLSDWFSLGNLSGKSRVYIHDIYLVFGEIVPVYPTSLVLTGSDSVRTGKSMHLQVTYAPENVNTLELTFESSDDTVATVDQDGVVTGVSDGEVVITVSAPTENATISASKTIQVYTPTGSEKVAMQYTYRDYADKNIYPIDVAPALGKAKLLVIPIWFEDSSQFIDEDHREDVRSDIEDAYFGSYEDIGWHSVKSYYGTESMGALEIDGTVAEWYEAEGGYSKYATDDPGMNYSDALVKEASDHYFETHPTESRKDYDCDGNGFLDGVMLIYAAPDYNSFRKYSYGNLWAYCYWQQNMDYQNVQNPGPNVYFWASYDFMYDSSTAKTRTGKTNYGAGETSHCTVDAHTFIHEMGHVFGLEDYYDYGTNGYSPAAGFSMQDNNVGAHDPYSVMALGWADPYIPTASEDIIIKPFQVNHDLILLTPEWNSFDSPFDEYLLLELYTPTGLNELDTTYSYQGSLGPSATGLRLWHVDARLVAVNDVKNDYPVYSADNITCDVNEGYYGVQHAFSNTYVTKSGGDGYGSPLGADYYKYDMLHLIRNSTTETYKTSSFLSNASLFGNGASFSMSKFKAQFPNSGKLDSNVDLGWSFTVEITGKGENAEATVHLVKE